MRGFSCHSTMFSPRLHPQKHTNASTSSEEQGNSACLQRLLLIVQMHDRKHCIWMSCNLVLIPSSRLQGHLRTQEVQFVPMLPLIDVLHKLSIKDPSSRPVWQGCETVRSTIFQMRDWTNALPTCEWLLNHPQHYFKEPAISSQFSGQQFILQSRSWKSYMVMLHGAVCGILLCINWLPGFP